MPRLNRLVDKFKGHRALTLATVADAETIFGAWVSLS